MNRLQGKVALVTGGGGGMGASHARAIAAEGGKVVVADIRYDAAKAIADSIGDAAIAVDLDVTQTESWQAAVEKTDQHFGKLNVLVNNAGILNFGSVEEMSDEEWDRVIAVNLTGPFKGIRAAADLLRRSAPSSVINISSMAGQKGFPGIVGYNASKFGIRGLTKAAALDLCEAGIRVNTICPGNTDTEMVAGLYEDQSFPGVPLHRLGRPEEISNLVVFLASDESSFSTGADFIADGGELAGSPSQFS